MPSPPRAEITLIGLSEFVGPLLCSVGRRHRRAAARSRTGASTASCRTSRSSPSAISRRSFAPSTPSSRRHPDLSNKNAGSHTGVKFVQRHGAASGATSGLLRNCRPTPFSKYLLDMHVRHELLGGLAKSSLVLPGARQACAVNGIRNLVPLRVLDELLSVAGVLDLDAALRCWRTAGDNSGAEERQQRATSYSTCTCRKHLSPIALDR